MQVKWLAEAAQDLADIRLYISRDNPAAAQDVAKRIRETISYLRDHPEIGRAGRIPKTREIVIPGLPYIVPYRVRGGAIEILGVLHGARQPQTDASD
ncbi:MAG: type II toxin-antitoxin system RelE/ParE family toxin [Nitrospirota bacterium]